MEHSEALELIPLYALDALEGDEATNLEGHLAGCDECRGELDTYRSVTSSLAPDEPAPDHLWEGIVAELGAEATPIGQVETSRKASPPLMWFAGVAAALVVVLGVVSVYQANRIAELSQGGDVVAAAELASETPGAVVAELVGEEGSVVEVILTPDGEGFVVPRGLAPLGSDRTYQLWVLTPDELVISAGVLGSSPGASRFLWDGEVAGFALTREKAGGVVSSEGDVVSVAEL